MKLNLSKIGKIARVIFKIGIWNVAQVLRYRLAMRLGVIKFKAIGSPHEDDLYFSPFLSAVPLRPVSQALFGWKDVILDGPPSWHCSALQKDRCVDKSIPWQQALSSIPPDVDVKEIWELSRFYWAPRLARDARNGDAAAGATLNAWLKDWMAENPPYLGINWSCGQEAAIRILHCAQAAIILDEVLSPQEALVRFIANSAARIEPTLHYALSQSNNHGSAEAAGLFIAGTWLEALNADPRASRWKKLGRHWLENRANILILADGSSNQYSTNYHRVVLDTYCFVEVWRRKFSAPCFSAKLRSQLMKSCRWLYDMTDKATGIAPAFGANDGSLLLSGNGRNYADFRPSVQLGAALFCNALAYDSDQFDDLLLLYGIDRPALLLPDQQSRTYEHGGYILLRNRFASAIVRFPEYKFRPSHSDALHLDLYLNGKAIFFDGGTYSYAESSETDLAGVSAHNTVEFDGRDQMTRISRFLYSDWLVPSVVRGPEQQEGIQYCHVGYKDIYGCAHNRRVFLSKKSLKIIDKISGFKNNAVLRWRFSDPEYILNDLKLKCNGILIDFSATSVISTIRVLPSIYSPKYLKKENCFVLEVEVDRPGEIVTEIAF
jgi:hypothetical protein